MKEAKYDAHEERLAFGDSNRRRTKQARQSTALYSNRSGSSLAGLTWKAAANLVGCLHSDFLQYGSGTFGCPILVDWTQPSKWREPREGQATAHKTIPPSPVPLAATRSTSEPRDCAMFSTMVMFPTESEICNPGNPQFPASKTLLCCARRPNWQTHSNNNNNTNNNNSRGTNDKKTHEKDMKLMSYEWKSKADTTDFENKQKPYSLEQLWIMGILHLLTHLMLKTAESAQFSRSPPNESHLPYYNIQCESTWYSPRWLTNLYLATTKDISFPKYERWKFQTILRNPCVRTSCGQNLGRACTSIISLHVCLSKVVTHPTLKQDAENKR